MQTPYTEEQIIKLVNTSTAILNQGNLSGEFERNLRAALQPFSAITGAAQGQGVGSKTPHTGGR